MINRIENLKRIASDSRAIRKERGKILDDLDQGRVTAYAEENAASEAQVIIQRAALINQGQLADQLSKIATHAIQAVTKKPYEFVCEFVERRNSTECDMYLRLGGHDMDLFDSTGGGLADAASFALKVSYLLLSGRDRVLIMDEPARHVNGEEQRERYAQVMKEIAQEFSIQLILVSTLPQLITIADKVFTVAVDSDKRSVVTVN